MSDSISFYPENIVPENLEELSEYVQRQLLEISDNFTNLKRLTAEEEVLSEVATMFGNSGTYANGVTIANYTGERELDPNASIQQDTTTGIVTIGVGGLYNIQCYGAAIGQNNNQFYGLQLGWASNLSVIGIDQWSNSNPGMAWSVAIGLLLTTGDTIFMQSYSSGGTLTLSNAYLNVSLLELS